MNNLSWLIYMSNVLPNLGTTLNTLSVICMLGVVFVVLFYGMMEDWGGLKRSLLFSIIPIVGVMIAVLIPSEKTIYLIAASQVGEQVIQLEQMQSLGGELGGLASDTISILREKLAEQFPDVSKLSEATSPPN